MKKLFPMIGMAILAVACCNSPEIDEEAENAKLCEKIEMLAACEIEDSTAIDIPAPEMKMLSVLAHTLPQPHQELFAEAECDSLFTRDLETLCASHRALYDSGKSRFAILDDQWIPDEVLAFTRRFRRDVVLVLANFSPKYTSCALPDGVQWSDAFTGEIWEGELVCPVLDPWGYKILLRR